ncbi:MAG: hypothetical protein ABI813_12975 [Bacteroidota bacterium]
MLHKTLLRTDKPESATVVHNPTISNTNGQRANQILDALIIQTSQTDYDEVTVEKLIIEYQSLMS